MACTIPQPLSNGRSHPRAGQFCFCGSATEVSCRLVCGTQHPPALVAAKWVWGLVDRDQRVRAKLAQRASRSVACKGSQYTLPIGRFAQSLEVPWGALV